MRDKKLKLVGETPEEALARPPEFSDEALATDFAHAYADELRYCAAWGKWLRWDGGRWAPEETMLAFDYARTICREAAARCRETRIAGALASSKTVAAVERLAKADRRLAATSDQWDTDPWILNTPGGIVDLRSGKIRDHETTDYVTKQAAVSPGGDCPTWRKFLERVTNGDTELQGFIQRIAGYSLTGDTSAQALFFGYGTGANGKSVMLETFAGILGDYHKQAPIETFTATNIDRHPTDLAGLRGARLVTAVETEEGRRWAESRIKALTGGDMVSARFMRGDFFEFRPQFKLFIAGNHKPGLRSVDEAIRRRFNLIPFAVTIPQEERDPKLAEKLKDEWSGILSWMIQGCLDWQANGLDQPEAVKLATKDYLEGEDALGAWLEECCELDVSSWELSGSLFTSWKVWAEKAGEYAGTAKKLSQQLQARGFEPIRKSTGRGLGGIRIRPNASGNGSWQDEWERP